MSGIDKLGNAQELTRVMASDMCAACGAILLPTPQGKVCLTCSSQLAQVEQDEKPWDEFRRQATESVPEPAYERIRDENNRFQVAMDEAQASPPVTLPALPQQNASESRVEVEEILRVVRETRDELVAIYSKLSAIVQPSEHNNKEKS